ncbi:uncharacterized protein N7482_006728 [Penicillium canariense]|uniref:Myb-like DNA-binding domain-containing protein n=1 Tax=Penicillium canariense TaxID=189055 RepID=A0A9W9LJF4_9EURO|nr:uncharacterized protein N7482_006728 [Penicillium canariense]KAJ5159724.1 hypothetical protein N7482_006728 [Penicillium canariense]
MIPTPSPSKVAKRKSTPRKETADDVRFIWLCIKNLTKNGNNIDYKAVGAACGVKYERARSRWVKLNAALQEQEDNFAADQSSDWTANQDSQDKKKKTSVVQAPKKEEQEEI